MFTKKGSGKKVFVGLSGGVDSAVSAALLQKEGYDLHGVFIRIALPGYPCSAGADKIDAMRVAAHLRIPFEEIDLSKEYEEEVFKISVAEFARGRTPNPDILCNREVKFGTFFKWCIQEGADYVATGHYARTKKIGEETHLLAGVDTTKDQSYFLWAVPESALQKTLFPIGHLKKTAVRVLAKKFRLPNAERKDSQGLCFLSGITVEDMLHKELHPEPGNVLSESGEVIGMHDGAALYTLGQRHGFILSSQSPTETPHFVVKKDAAANTITVSTSRFPKGVTETALILTETNWIGAVSAGACKARFRYRQSLIAADYRNNSVILREPYFVPEGQSVVLYEGQRCSGGGIVDKVTHLSV